jgi:uncharacterized membrane protein
MAPAFIRPKREAGGPSLDAPLTRNPTRGLPAAEDGSEESLGSLLVPDRLAVWVWVLGYTALLTSLSVLRYGLWVARGDDLGVFEQGLWLLAHRGVHAVSTYTGQPILADGASFILVLLAPLYAVGGVGCLLTLQSLAFGIGYYFIRRMGSALRVAPEVAHTLGVIYLLYPTVLGVNLYDFHPQAFGVPLLFAAACALSERRWLAYTILICTAALVGGGAAPVLVGFGVALILQGKAAWGAPTALVGLGSGALDALVLIPWLTHGAGSPWLAVYGSVASGPVVGLSAVVHHPQILLSWAKHLRSWEYILWLLGPFAGIALTLRSRLLTAWWLPALLLMEVNLVSGIPSVSSPFTEYSVLAVPFLFLAILAGASEGRSSGGRRSTIWLAPVAVLLLVFGTQQFRSYWRGAPTNVSTLAAAVAVVPKDAPIIAQDYVLPHVADRAQEWQLAALGSFTVPTGSYLVLDNNTSSSPDSPDVVARARALLADKEETMTVFSNGGVMVGKVLRPIGPSG